MMVPRAIPSALSVCLMEQYVTARRVFWRAATELVADAPCFFRESAYGRHQKTGLIQSALLRRVMSASGSASHRVLK